MNNSAASLPEHPTFVVVIVLYRTAPGDSAAFTTLSSLLQTGIVPPQTLYCVIYDNGPVCQPVPSTPFPVIYRHNPANPGLAEAYAFALQTATQSDATWLLLLDQDTHLTSAYLAEVVQQAKAAETVPTIVGLSPKLLQGDTLLSPHWPPRHSHGPSLRERYGPIEPTLRVFNSGSMLRVSAVEAIGGFPQQFPLDYLDHAVFDTLQKRGGTIYLLHAELQHNLASLEMDPTREFPRSARFRSILRAESRFYRNYGSLRDRCVYTLRRSRLLLRMIAAGNFSGAALLLRYTLRP